jgi:serpin B
MSEQPGTAGVAAADDAFGADLYRVLADGDAQTVFSPVSVAAALRMALCGARGQTAAELAGALHEAPDAAAGGPSATAAGELSATAAGELSATAAEGLRATSAAVQDATADGSVTLRAPSIVWVQSGLPLLAEFTSQLGADAAADIGRVGFAEGPDEARAEINRVIAEQTDGKITGLLPAPAVSARTRLVLTSAIYLKAGWADPFPEADTRDTPFWPDGPDHPDLTVPMMHSTAPRAYRHSDGYQAVVLPYRGGRLAMAIVLPDGPLATLRPVIAASGLRGLLAGTSRYQVTLALPRFRLEAAVDLIPILYQLGVREAFTGQADFSGITEAERLAIGAVAHKAYVDVDEQGTEAAAATAVSFRPTAVFRAPTPVTMTVDRPFLFVIIHTPTGLPLFVGQVRRP